MASKFSYCLLCKSVSVGVSHSVLMGTSDGKSSCM